MNIKPAIGIRSLCEQDIHKYEDHIERSCREQEEGKTPLFMVLQDGEFKRKPEEIGKLWLADLHSGQWRRTWGAWIGNKIIGHLYIQGTGDPHSRHRAIISIGIEFPYRRNGLGRELVNAGLSWTKDQEQIEWVDFSVFSSNVPSLEFCKSFGFQEIGFVQDALRIKGQKIDLIKMTRKIDR